MNAAESTSEGPGVSGDPAVPGETGQLLVVEPEELVRWSLVTYLTRWFDVFTAESRAVADRILDDRRIDAVVVSDDLTDRAAEEIEAHARSRNPSVRVVRTVTNPPGGQASVQDTFCLEKPFELSELASLLGAS